MNLVRDLIEYRRHVSHVIDRKHGFQHLPLFAMLVVCGRLINENHKCADGMMTHEGLISVPDPGQGGLT